MKKSSTLNFPIIIEQDEDNVYIVSCPMFKGCHSYGNTIDEALKNIQEVIEICLEETPIENLNNYIGYREVQLKAHNKKKFLYA
jgi:predicted RNase H-like HicB family nuclease